MRVPPTGPERSLLTVLVEALARWDAIDLCFVLVVSGAALCGLIGVWLYGLWRIILALKGCPL